MKSDPPRHATIGEYIADFPPSVQAMLQALRQAIRAAVPDAEEAIKYRMPTFVLNGNLIHFAAFKHHIGVFPTPRGIEAFPDETAPFVAGRGTLQFPHGQPIPLDLIARIAAFRAESCRTPKASQPAPKTPKTPRPRTTRS